MEKTEQLYLIKFKSHRTPDCYVIAECPTKASDMVVSCMEDEEVGFNEDRAIESITILAENCIGTEYLRLYG